MLVFDVTNRRSFENLIQWIAEINRFLNKDGVVIHLVGNKVIIIIEIIKIKQKHMLLI